jgi:hypothetical protein
MAAIDFFGYLFLALGPSAAFFGVFIAPKSFVVLLSLFRCASPVPSFPGCLQRFHSQLPPSAWCQSVI